MKVSEAFRYNSFRDNIVVGIFSNSIYNLNISFLIFQLLCFSAQRSVAQSDLDKNGIQVHEVLKLSLIKRQLDRRTLTTHLKIYVGRLRLLRLQRN